MPHPPKKVLIINIFGIGDVLFTTPLISNLKAAYPDLYIGYLCNRRTAPLLEHNPKINTIFVYERDEFYAVRQRSKLLYAQKIWRFIREIRKKRFETVFDVSLNSFMGFLTFAAGIKERIGFDYKGRGFFLTQKVDLQGYEDKHVVDYYLDLLGNAGIPVSLRRLELPLRDGDLNWAMEFVKHNRLEGRRPLIGLVPGGGASWGKEAVYKRWPAERYAKLADKLVEKFSAEIILMGGPQDRELCQEVGQWMKNRFLTACGETDICQFAALTKQCSAVILNDGGPLHVAVAAGARTVSLFGPVDERVYGPYPQENHLVVRKELACRPCYRKFRRAACAHISCLNQITVEDVLEKVEAIGL